jgi:hypothetical protein
MDVYGKVGKSIRLSHKAPTASRGTLRGFIVASGHGNVENPPVAPLLPGFPHSHSLQLFFYRIEWIDINEKGASSFIVLLKPDSKGFKKNL